MRTTRLLACLATLLLSACGGGGDDDAAAPTATPDASVVDIRTVSAVIDPSAGGALRSDGLALEFPAAAFGRSAKEVTLVTRSTAAGAIASFRVAPAGARLQQPATLTYTANSLPANARLFWNIDGALTLVPGSRTGNTLSTTITSLGYTAGGKRQPLRASVLMQRLGADGRSRALAESGTGGNLEVRLLQCEEQAETLRVRLNATDWQTDADRAIALHDELVELRESCSGVQLRAIEQRACDALSLAVDNASVFAVTSMPAFKELVTTLHNAAAMAQSAGATCAAAGGATPEARAAELIEAKFDQLLSFVEARVVNAGFAGTATQVELTELMGLAGDCERLGLDAPCVRIADELYPRVLDILRSTAFDACRATGAPEPSRLHALGQAFSTPEKFFGFAGYGPLALETDAMYCTNPGLGMKVFRGATTLADEITARAKSIDALGSLNEYQRSASIKVPPNGSLGVTGRVQALRCADGTLSNAELVFRISGRELARYPRNGDVYTLATQPLEFVVERDLARVGLPTSGVDTRTLSLVREGGGCEAGAETVFNQPFTLFSVALDLSATAGEPPPVVPPPPPAKWAGAVNLDYRFTVSYDETRSSSTGCGFVFAPCDQTSRGSYTGALTYSLTGTTPDVVTIGQTADLSIGVGTTGGSVSSTGREISTGTLNGCTNSTNADLGFTAEPASAVSQGLWNLSVSDAGLMEIGTNVFRTTVSTFRTGRTILTSSAGCSGGALTTIVSDRGPGEGRNVFLALSKFRGTVDPGSNVWAGSQTLTFTGSGAECEQFIIDTPARGAGEPGVTASNLTCSGALRATWSLGRQ